MYFPLFVSLSIFSQRKKKMNELSSLEWQELIINLIDSSYSPFVILYPVIWAWAILQKIFEVL